MDEQTTFEIPADLTDLTADQLGSAVESATAEYESLRDVNEADITDEQIDRMNALADFVDAVGAEEQRRETATAERAERRAAAVARMEGGDDTEGDDADGDAPADGDTPEQPEAEQDQQPVESVAASGGIVRRVGSRRSPAPAADAPVSRFSITAAADFPTRAGITAGAALDGTLAVAEAFIERSKVFDKAPRRPGTHLSHSVASFRRNRDADSDGLYVGNRDYADAQALLAAAGKESRLPGGSLTAAGGWCAPSTTMYGLCQKESLDGIIDLPEIGVERGGINYTPGPDWADIFAGAGFAQTEAEAIAGETKECVEIDCPDFTEVRLDAVGICVKTPLLTRAAYPELVQRWVEGTIIANQHKIGQRLIAGIRNALGAPVVPVFNGGFAWDTLTVLELIAEGERERQMLADDETIEVVLPKWVRVALRSDLANRMGIGRESVSNAQIMQHFTDRNIMPQFVRGYLPLTVGATGGAPVAFPTVAEALVYTAGTFVKGTADVISLDTVYDVQELQENTLTAAFAEDGVLLAKVCQGGTRVSLPVCVTGRLGAADVTDCYGVTPAPGQ